MPFLRFRDAKFQSRNLNHKKPIDDSGQGETLTCHSPALKRRGILETFASPYDEQCTDNFLNTTQFVVIF